MGSSHLPTNPLHLKFSETKNKENIPLFKLILPMNPTLLKKRVKSLVSHLNSIVMIVPLHCLTSPTSSQPKKICPYPQSAILCSPGSRSNTLNQILFVLSRTDKRSVLARVSNHASIVCALRAKKRICGSFANIHLY